MLGKCDFVLTTAVRVGDLLCRSCAAIRYFDCDVASQLGDVSTVDSDANAIDIFYEMAIAAQDPVDPRHCGVGPKRINLCLYALSDFI